MSSSNTPPTAIGPWDEPVRVPDRLLQLFTLEAIGLIQCWRKLKVIGIHN
jgi:hypothetical protein